jgi:hypothetical protein
MKSTPLLALSLALAGIALFGCERHSFDETKGLNLEHGAGHGGEGHGEAGHAADTHGKDGHSSVEKAAESKPSAHPEAAKGEPKKTGL